MKSFCHSKDGTSCRDAIATVSVYNAIIFFDLIEFVDSSILIHIGGTSLNGPEALGFHGHWYHSC